MNKWFNNFASTATTFVAKPYFFAACVLVVILWAPSYFIIGSMDTWQLIINTLTTIVTFLLVALLQNDQERFEQATNKKLDAIARGIGELLEDTGNEDTARHMYEVMGIEEEVEP